MADSQGGDRFLDAPDPPGPVSPQRRGIPRWVKVVGVVPLVALAATVATSLVGENVEPASTPEDALALINEQSGQSLTAADVNAIAAAGQSRIDAATLDRLQGQCQSGDLVSCDVLGIVAPEDSTYRLVGRTCGDRNEPLGIGAGYCIRYHDELDLDGLRQACGDRDFGSCDLLWVHVPFGHEDEAFAEQCGGVGVPELVGLCLLTYGVGTR